MGVNNSVNVKQMRKRAQEINEVALKMSKRFDNVFGDVIELQNNWKGQAYVNFVRIVNGLDDNFTKISKYFCITLPEEIMKKSNVYARAQSEEVAKGGKFAGYPKYKNVPIKSQGDTLVFNEDKVQATQDTIEKRFSNVESDLQRLSELFDQIPWTGTAKTTSTKIFKNNINEALAVMKKIKNALSQNMMAAINANKKAETGNASSAEKPDVSSIGEVSKVAEQRAKDLNSGNYDHTKETL